MNAIATFTADAPAIVPFNAYAAYQRERQWARCQEQLLARALTLLASQADRAARRGDDVSHIRSFIAKASA